MPRETLKAKIERLEKELMEIKQFNADILIDNQRLSQEVKELQDQKNDDFINSPLYRQLEDKISNLQVHNEILHRQLNKAKEKNDFLIEKLNESSEGEGE